MKRKRDSAKMEAEFACARFDVTSKMPTSRPRVPATPRSHLHLEADMLHTVASFNVPSCLPAGRVVARSTVMAAQGAPPG